VVNGSHQLQERIRGQLGVLEDSCQQLGTDPLALVDCKHQGATVRMGKKSVTALPANLTESRAHECLEDAPRCKLGKLGHVVSGGDLDLDRHRWLAWRASSLLAKGLDIELQGPARTLNRLAAGPTVHVAARYLGHRADIAPICLAVDDDHVVQLHELKVSTDRCAWPRLRVTQPFWRRVACDRENNKDRMRYVALRYAGLPVGSGVRFVHPPHTISATTTASVLSMAPSLPRAIPCPVAGAQGGPGAGELEGSIASVMACLMGLPSPSSTRADTDIGWAWAWMLVISRATGEP